MHATWKGYLSFGLVHIPVSLHTGITERSFPLHLYHDKDHAPIHYARICEKEGKEIPWEHVVKGYENKKGKILVLNEKELEKLHRKKSSTIEILSFAEKAEIDPIFFEKPYFLAPGKNASKPYLLLRETLKKSGKVAVAKFVLHQREHICIIEAYEHILLLNQMRFLSEIRSPKSISLPKKAAISPQEMKAALSLVDGLTEPFRPEKYRDTYEEELKKILSKKGKGKLPEPKESKAKSTKIHDLLPALKESLSDIPKKRKVSSLR